MNIPSMESISGDIVGALCLELAVSAQPAFRTETSNRWVYELFLKRRSHYLGETYKHSTRVTKSLFTRAAINRRSYLFPGVTRSDEAGPVTDRLLDSQRALDIDADLPSGYAARGLAHYATGGFAATKASLRKAVGLDLQHFEAQFFLARQSVIKATG